MPETDPRTPDPLKRDAPGGAYTSGTPTQDATAAGADYSARSAGSRLRRLRLLRDRSVR